MNRIAKCIVITITLAIMATSTFSCGSCSNSKRSHSDNTTTNHNQSESTSYFKQEKAENEITTHAQQIEEEFTEPEVDLENPELERLVINALGTNDNILHQSDLDKYYVFGHYRQSSISHSNRRS